MYICIYIYMYMCVYIYIYSVYVCVFRKDSGNIESKPSAIAA